MKITLIENNQPAPHEIFYRGIYAKGDDVYTTSRQTTAPDATALAAALGEFVAVLRFEE